MKQYEPYLHTVAQAVAAAMERGEAQGHIQRLTESNRDLERFAYIASHDLQEPLRMITSYTQLLSRRYSGRLDADADEFIGYAVSGALRMQHLIQDLLNYSRASNSELETRSIPSTRLVETALSNLRRFVEEKDARIEVATELPVVRGDESQLVELFQNLLVWGWQSANGSSNGMADASG